METIKTILTAETGQFSREFNKAKSTIDDYHKRILQIGAALGGSALLAGAVGKFNAIRNSIDQLNDQAARLEMPVEEMQRLNAVTAMSGSSVETLAKALTKSKLNAIEAAGGSESLAKSFADLGINAGDFVNLDPTERILALSRGFNAATDQGAAFSAIFKVMGKSAGELIPLLRDGEEGIAAISARLQVLGGNDVKAIAKLSDEIDLLSSNLKTQVGGALISLRPQIEGFIGLLSKAADGLATLLDPAGGVGKQGGELGGAAMLREIDRLQAKAEALKKTLATTSFGFGENRGAAVAELNNTSAAVETLKARYAGLDDEAKAYAEQLREFERLRASGMGEDDLRAQLQVLQGRTSETLSALAAEKQLAVAAGATAAEMEKQKDELVKMVKSMETLQQKVGSRIIALQSPEKRQEVARAGLEGLLSREGAGNVDELRTRVGTASNEGDRMKALTALDEALDRLEEIKKASAEIQSSSTSNFQAWNAAIKSASDTTRQALEDGRKLLDMTTEQKAEDAAKDASRRASRADYQAEFIALRLQLTGRKGLADKFREETALRKEALAIADAQGLSEEDALKLATQRAQLVKDIAAQEEKAALRAQRHPGWKPRSEYRGITRAENAAGDFNSGNNLRDWNSEWNMGRATRSNGRSIKSAEGSLKQDALRRRQQERETAALRNSSDPSIRLLQKLADTTDRLNEGLKRIGVIK